MFVPAMPGAAIALGVSPSMMQLTLTIYLGGMGVGQIVSGPLADRVGRRPVLLGGIALFVAGSAACWAAPSITLLLAGRATQALGASAGVVVGRSMAGDAGARGARDMALLSAIVMLSPMLAPLLGGALQNLAGWRSIFAVLASAAGLCGLAAIRGVPETRAIRGIPAAGSPAGWAGIVIEAGFARNLALSTALSGGLYVFLTASPFLLVETYHADPRRLGIYYGLVALGAALGALASSRLAGGWTIDRLIRVGTAVAAAGALGFALTAVLGWRDSLGLIVPMMVFAFGGGLAIPNAMIAALTENQQRIGTAVSAFGALQMLGNAAITSGIASTAPRNVVIVALGIAGLAAFAASLGFREEVGG